MGRDTYETVVEPTSSVKYEVHRKPKTTSQHQLKKPYNTTRCEVFHISTCRVALHIAIDPIHSLLQGVQSLQHFFEGAVAVGSNHMAGVAHFAYVGCWSNPAWKKNDQQTADSA